MEGGFQIDHYILDKSHILGKGAYSSVYLGWDLTNNNSLCAVKEQMVPTQTNVV
jgi:hypothetical protein